MFKFIENVFLDVKIDSGDFKMEVKTVGSYKPTFRAKPDKYVQGVFDDAIRSIKKNGTDQDLILAEKYIKDITDFGNKDKADNQLSLFLHIGQKLKYFYRILLSTKNNEREVCSFPTKDVHQKPLDTIKLIRDKLIG